MNVSVKHTSAPAVETDLLVVYLFQGESAPAGAAGAVDRALGGRLSDVLKAGDLQGKLGESALLYRQGSLAAQRVLAVGLGKPAEFSLEVIRHAAGAAAKRARELRVPRLATTVPLSAGIAPADAAQAVTEGAILALYDFRRHKSQSDEPAVEVSDFVLIDEDADKIGALSAGARVGQIGAESVCLARDLVNAPANYATPTIVAEAARAMAEQIGLRCEVLDKPRLAELGMGAFLGVNQGSDEPPKFVILEHGADQGRPTIVLVGKGITFDSGGISIKPSEDLHKMKDDMSGGAAVIYALRAAALLDIPLHVVGLVPLTENLPSGKAYKPGDVLVTMSGKTIEIISTDAEGRLILADALTYAARYKPAAVIDIATLTGACNVALGSQASGLFDNDDKLAARLEAAGQKSGERVWRMPMFKEYGEQIKSDVADMKNTGGRPAGAITAAMLLSRFAEGYPWAHLDIAGTSWVDKPSKPYLTVGGTGVGVRLFIELLRSWR
jgi:leucyl aminopeptidase